MSLDLEKRVETLKGVGERLATKLEKLDIRTVGDLLTHYPRRYEDFSRVVPIRMLKPGNVTVAGEIRQIASRRAFRRQRLSITEAIISDETGTIKAVWFNQPYLVRQFPPGTKVFLSGRLEFKHNDLALQTPAVEAAETDEHRHTARIVPIYPETEGLTSRQLRGLILPLLPKADSLPDPLPPEILSQHNLMSFAEAVQEVHFPTNERRLSRARHRLAFQELFYLVLATLVIREDIRRETAPKIELNIDIVKQVVELQDFKLTDAQRKAAWQILQDLHDDKPMNRLLEGDVGSGKTLVAMIAACVAMASDHQVALMVPTDILARQHFLKLGPFAETLGFKAALLLGRQPAADKQATLAGLADGSVRLVIGTQALLSGPVKFQNLGLAIVDEQHRFGVSQRTALKSKAGHLPHLLTMTATPIPRSLALTVYGDLDLTIIDQLPPGRRKIITKVVRDKERGEVYDFIDQQIGEGRQVYVVTPLIEESDKLGAKSAVAEAERLRQDVLKHRRIGLLHGRLKPAEKQAVMDQFAAGQLDILVTTSVIEVGIDIPNATIMLIDGGDRFGLAALHQLRGRVGRSSHQSYCFLLYDNYSPGVAERLRAMERTNDGFRLAQIDLELRGPGQIYGVRQHGILDLELADISDTKLVAAVRQAATDFLKSPSSMVKYPQIWQRVQTLQAVTSLD